MAALTRFRHGRRYGLPGDGAAPEPSGCDGEDATCSRVLTVDKLMGHVLGHIGLPSRRRPRAPAHAWTPIHRSGKLGVEREYDEFLQGTPGTVAYRVNPKGDILEEISVEGTRSGLDPAVDPRRSHPGDRGAYPRRGDRAIQRSER